MPSKKNQREKRMNWSKKKENGLQRKDQESVLIQNAITIPFFQRSSMCTVS